MAMVKIKALRGLCLGVDRHLLPGEAGEVDAATSKWLVHIKAVEIIEEAPAKEEPAPAPEPSAPPAPPASAPGAPATEGDGKGHSDEKEKKNKR